MGADKYRGFWHNWGTTTLLELTNEYEATANNGNLKSQTMQRLGRKQSFTVPMIKSTEKLAAVHDLGCVALGYGIEAAAIVPSMEIVPKAFEPAGAKGGTSIASTLLRGGPRGLAIPTPVGTPGTATFAWRSSNTVGGVVGRWLPYVGLGVSSYRINKCLGQQP